MDRSAEKARETLIGLIKDDMTPALGVTEPGAIAYACAVARKYAQGEISLLTVRMNSGMYKNAFTCGIPNSGSVGALYAAALGFVAGDPDKGLEVLADITEEDNKEAKRLADEGKVMIALSGITSRIFIEAELVTESDTVTVTIRDRHTDIKSIVVNGDTVFSETSSEVNEEEEEAVIHGFALSEIFECVKSADTEELRFINEAFRVNLELFDEGMASGRTVFLHRMLEENGGCVYSDDVKKTAQLLCNGAIESRVIGLSKPAMSITGSGAHGIIATMPLYAYARVNDLSEEILLRATALSFLVCMYIKEYSGRLSAFCGCGIAAGTGTACGLAFMMGGDIKALERTILNMAAGITGMICDGGNQGCTMKGIVALDAAFRAAEYAVNGISVESVHGICGDTPEDTMRYMGMIASPGMTGTEKTIIDIMTEKASDA